MQKGGQGGLEERLLPGVRATRPGRSLPCCAHLQVRAVQQGLPRLYSTNRWWLLGSQRQEGTVGKTTVPTEKRVIAKDRLREDTECRAGIFAWNLCTSHLREVGREQGSHG